MASRLEHPGHRLEDGASALTLVQAPFSYREQAPPGEARGVVACMWGAHVASAHGHRLRVLPDGCVEIVAESGRPTLVYGPRAAWQEIDLDAGAAPRGLRLRAGVAASLLGFDIAELAERTVELDRVVSWSPDPDQPSQLALAHVRAKLVARGERVAPDQAALGAVALFREHPGIPVGAVARELGLSERQLRRRFAHAVGLTPLAFRRLARVDAALRTALRRPAWTWAQVAYELAYADQAHLSREVHAVTGRPPNTLL